MTGLSRSANVAHLLQRVADACGERPAVLGSDGRVLWTFGGLADAASRVAAGLVRCGIAPGDRVVALAPDLSDFILVACGILWAGGTVCIPPRGGLTQALGAAAATRPRGVVASPLAWGLASLDSRLRHAPIRIATGRWGFGAATSLATLRASHRMAPAATALNDAAIVSYTTGSTGEPKAVVRTHGVLMAQHEALSTLRSPGNGVIDLAGLPLLVLHNLASGVTSVLPPSRETLAARYGKRVCETLHRTQATTAAGFPSLFEAVVEHATSGSLPRLRAIQVGGAHVRPELLLRLQAVACAAEITVVYGSTEAEPITAIDGAAYLARRDRTAAGEGICVGRPWPGIEVCVFPLPRGDAVEAATVGRSGSLVGRVMVKGARVAVGPGSEQVEGWLDTGDAGWLDGDGQLWLMGRCTNAVKGSLFPAQVEPIVETLPWAGRAALVNVSVGARQRPVLAAEPRTRSSRATRECWRLQLTTLAAERGWPLAGVAILDRLPRDTRSGSKIDYPRLARLVRRVVEA